MVNWKAAELILWQKWRNRNTQDFSGWWFCFSPSLVVSQVTLLHLGWHVWCVTSNNFTPLDDFLHQQWQVKEWPAKMRPSEWHFINHKLFFSREKSHQMNNHTHRCVQSNLNWFKSVVVKMRVKWITGWGSISANWRLQIHSSLAPIQLAWWKDTLGVVSV